MTPLSEESYSNRKYDVYYGDVDADEFEDILFYGKPQFILLHGDIATPIQIPAPQSMVYYGSGGDFDGAVEWNGDSAILTSLIQYQSSSQIIVANNEFFESIFNPLKNQQDVAAEFKYDVTEGLSFEPGDGETFAITEGSESVVNGNATYTVPIELPPSILAPSLSLKYTSASNKRSTLGVGWSLAGLSSISRCKATYATEQAQAQKSNPRYSLGDRLCLDGQKLVLLDGENDAADSDYWANDAVYTTERDSFVKVEAKDDHSWFKVSRRNGEIAYFGKNDSSSSSLAYRPGDFGGDIKIWGVDEVQDRYGNYYTVEYVSDSSTYEFYPTAINLTPGAKVILEYSQASDQAFYFDAGEKTVFTKKLDAITTYVSPSEKAAGEGRDVVSRYDIAYKDSVTTDRLLVDSLQRCGYDLFGIEQCAEPLTFKWTEGELGFEETASYLMSCDNKRIHATYLMDINEDGYPDIFRSKNIRDIRLNSVAQILLPYIYDKTNACYEPQEWLTDFFVRNAVQRIKPVNTQHGNFYVISRAKLVGYMSEMALATFDIENEDVNISPIQGDYSTRDVAGVNASRIRGVAINDNKTMFGTLTGSLNVADLNNDGRQDFLLGTHAFYQTPTTFARDDTFRFIGVWEPFSEFLTTDFNGDGMNDILSSYTAWKETGWALLSSAQNAGGAGFSDNLVKFMDASHSSIHTGAKLYTQSSEVFLHSYLNDMSKNSAPIFNAYLDVNGDGYKDVAYHSGGRWKVRLGNGEHFTDAIDTGISAGTEKNQYFYAFDYDKDGREDLIVQYRKSSGTNNFGWKLLRSSNEGGVFKFEEFTDLDPFDGKSAVNYAPAAVEFGSVFRGDFNYDGVMDHYRSGIDAAFNVDEDSRVYFGKRAMPDKLLSVTNGLGRKATFSYDTLNDRVLSETGKPMYMPGSDNTEYNYPYTRPNRAMYIVTGLETSNGVGGILNTYFNYYGGKVDVRGRGFLGFDKIIRTDKHRKIQTETHYALEWPYTGMPKAAYVSSLDDKKISTVDTEYKTHASNERFVYPHLAIKKEYNLQTSVVNASKTENQFDQYGGLTKQRVVYGKDVSSNNNVTSVARSTLTVNTLENDADEWLLGFKTKVQVASSPNTITSWSIPAATAQVKVATHSFTPQSGTLDVAVEHKYQGSSIAVKTIYTRDESGGALPGVVTEVAMEAMDIDGQWTARRKLTSSNFLKGVFPRKRTNALNHASNYDYDVRFGMETLVTDANNLSTSNTYDAFGRVSSLGDVNGNVQDVVRYACGNGPLVCDAPAVYYSITRTSHITDLWGKLAQPANADFYDALNREVKSQVFGLNNSVVSVDIVYNENAYLYKKSQPYSENAAEHFKVFASYDAMGAPLKIIEPDGGQVDIAYGLDNLGRWQKTVTYDVANSLYGANDQVTKTIFNALGEVAEVIDANDTSVVYQYDALGNLSSTKTAANDDTSVTLNHDLSGNKTYLDDPAAGKIHFEFNGFGELRKQVWQKGTSVEKSITYQYDLLGRQVHRSDDSVTGEFDAAYTWVFDTRKKGLLTHVIGEGYKEEYFYNNLAQVEKTNTAIPGASVRSFDFDYDKFGRLKRKTYPSGLVVEQRYSGTGEHVQTLNVTAGIAEVVWALGNEVDARGNYIYQRYGNGVITARDTYADSGQLKRIRTGYATNGSINGFSYDIQDLRYSWDSLGNLQSRTTARQNRAGSALENSQEVFEYDDLNRLKLSTTTWLGFMARSVDYDYDVYGNLIKNSQGVVQYNQVNGASVYGVTRAGGKDYHYDVYGNVIRKGGQVIEYDVFNKPVSLGNTEFIYGPYHEKLKQIDGTNGVATYYFDGGEYEEVIEAGSTTKRANVAGFYIHEVVGSQSSARYLHFDHLGSVEALSDESGDFIARMSFDAFGNRLKDDWQNPPANSYFEDHFSLTWGYTGHDMIDQEGVIHMGGRVYDPSVGRFLSADIFVQAPFNSQSYNRYSYVMNNPLSLVDPTGYRTECVQKGNETVCTYYDDGNDSGNDYDPGMFDDMDNTMPEPPGTGDYAEAMAVAVIPGASTVQALADGEYAEAAVEAGTEVVSIVAGFFSGSTGYFAIKAAKAVRAAKKAKKSLNAGCKKARCFAAGTQVLTDQGFVDIEALQVGDKVLAHDPDTGESDYKPILQTFVNTNDAVWNLTLRYSSGEVTQEVTGSHPYYAVNSGWVEVANLGVGDSLLLEGGQIAEVIALSNTGIVQTTYNVHVEGINTFHVSAAKVLVHNCGVTKGAKKVSTDPPIQQVDPRNLIPTQTRNEISGSAVKRLKKDMQKNGFDQSQPVDAVRNSRGRLEIEDGHHRTEAARKAGLDKIPVRVWGE